MFVVEVLPECLSKNQASDGRARIRCDLDPIDPAAPTFAFDPVRERGWLPIQQLVEVALSRLVHRHVELGETWEVAKAFPSVLVPSNVGELDRDGESVLQTANSANEVAVLCGLGDLEPVGR